MLKIFVSGNGAIEPSMITIPPIEHWAPVHVIPTEVGIRYRWIVVSTKDDVLDIRIFSTGLDLLLRDIVPTLIGDVTPHSGGKMLLLC